MGVQTVAAEASKLTILEASVAPEKALAKRLKRHPVRLIAVLAYLIVGVVFYTSVSQTADIVNDRPLFKGVTWSFTVALYFVAVTISTVGYGGLSIYQSSDGTKYFTAALLLIY